MYKVSDLMEFVGSKHKGILQVYSNPLGYINLTNGTDAQMDQIKEMALSSFEVITDTEFGTFSIPQFVSTDTLHQKKIIESLVLFQMDKYVGSYMGCEVKSTNKIMVHGPVYFTGGDIVTNLRDDGILEQYHANGGSAMYTYKKTKFVRLTNPTQWEFMHLLEDPYDRFMNPSSKPNSKYVNLIQPQNAHWGERIFYNPFFYNLIMINVDGMWLKVELEQVMKKAKGSLRDELIIFKNLFLNK